MASYKKYAEDLIGNWETSQYEPQRTVTKNIYQTNLTKLNNDFNTLKDKLARNFELAQNEYSNTLNDIQNQSFNRTRNANIDLANRGLTASGVGNLATQQDTQIKGQGVDQALADLLKTNNASIEGLTEGVMNLGEKQSSLAGDLAGDIGGITDQEAKNAQQYANLLAGIGEGAAGRAASRARSGGGSSRKQKKEKAEYDEIQRRLRIGDVLDATDISDDEKKYYLTTYLGVKGDDAIKAVDASNNNRARQALTQKRFNTQNSLNDYITENNLNPNLFTPEARAIINNYTKNGDTNYLANLVQQDRQGISPSSLADNILLEYYKNGMLGNALSTSTAQNKSNALSRIEDELRSLPASVSIADLLYGRR